MQNSIHYAGSDYTVTVAELAPDLLAALDDCGAPGDAQEAVNYVLRTFEITGDEKDCAQYLNGTGAWEASELEAHDVNLERLVWLAGCDLREDGEAHFCTY